jgi:outer membrane protein assembly factor BamB
VKLARHILRVPLVITAVLLAQLAPAPAAGAQEQIDRPARTGQPPAARPGQPPKRVDKKKEAQKGRPLSLVTAWRVTLAAPAASTPAADDERAYVALRSDTLVALSLADGKAAWTVPAANLAGSPETGDGLVFIAHAREVEALDGATGRQRWHVALPAAVSAPLLWQNGWLAVATESGDIVMLRGATGEQLWTRPLESPVTVRPATEDGRLYVLPGDGRVVALSLENGNPAWEATLPGKGTAILPTTQRVYVGCADRFLYGLDTSNGRTKWRWRTGGTIVGTPAVDEQFVYFLALDNILRALDRLGGTQDWKTTLAERPTDGPFLSAKLLLVPSMSVDLRAFHFIDGEAAGTTKLAGEPIAPPLFMPGAAAKPARLLVVTGESEAQLLEPGLPVLPSKRPEGLPFYTMPPVIDGSTGETPQP